MKSVLAHCLQFRSYDHLFVTSAVNSIPLFSEWRNTVTCILATRQVINGFRIKRSDLLDIQQEGLQLVVTQSYCNYKYNAS
jgi:hypothetical protein